MHNDDWVFFTHFLQHKPFDSNALLAWSLKVQGKQVLSVSWFLVVTPFRLLNGTFIECASM